jgi:hypothetical protein
MKMGEIKGILFIGFSLEKLIVINKNKTKHNQ